MFKVLTDGDINRMEVGDVAYLKAHIVDNRDPDHLAIYFGPWEDNPDAVNPKDYIVINRNDTQDPVVFVTSHLIGELTLISPKDNKWKMGQEVFVSIVVTRVMNGDKLRVTAAIGNDLDDLTNQICLLPGAYEGIIFEKSL